MTRVSLQAVRWIIETWQVPEQASYEARRILEEALGDVHDAAEKADALLRRATIPIAGRSERYVSLLGLLANAELRNAREASERLLFNALDDLARRWEEVAERVRQVDPSASPWLPAVEVIRKSCHVETMFEEEPPLELG